MKRKTEQRITIISSLVPGNYTRTPVVPQYALLLLPIQEEVYQISSCARRIVVHTPRSIRRHGWITCLHDGGTLTSPPTYKLCQISWLVVGVRFGCSVGCGTKVSFGWGIAFGCWHYVCWLVAGFVVRIELSSSDESHGWLLATDLVVCWVPAPKLGLVWARIWLFGLGCWSELGP